ncbi:Glycosyltransferase [Sulfidibacter corallicola]|uniref:Glycosyltransferase n=1 Tax=Sulfidibacter corallicola TaxID=2818388 RepID=A0A8A4TW77_SULCO|nr:glycosyltransferase [Sulfidibacter corallicola]QTD53222.1 glycosyltransferase [Sulfidibacter corallicola]
MPPHSPSTPPKNHPNRSRSAKIRVLRIQSRICIGGPSLNTLLVSSGLSQRKFTVLTVGGRLDPGEKTMEPFALERGAAMHMVGEMGRSVHWFDDVRALFKLMRLMRLYRPHVVHTHTAKAGALGRVAAFLTRVPVRMHTFHGHVFHGYFNAFFSKVAVWVERLLALMSHAIIAISPRQYEDLVTRYGVVPARKCRVVRLGFELDHIAGGEPGRFRGAWGLSPETRLVGIVARLVPIKNHQLLLHAIAHWRKLQPDAEPERVRFVVIGDGELREELESLAEALNIREFLLFTGWQRDTPAIYADLDLNVLVSKNEGTPVTLIEGLACGIPILSTDVGGIRDFADERHGTIVSADIAPEELGVHLHRLLGGSNPIPRLSQEVREDIKTTFHIRRLVGEIDALYAALLRKTHPELVSALEAAGDSKAEAT